MDATQSIASTYVGKPEWFDAALQWISAGIEASGVAVIVLGALGALLVAVLSYRRGAGLSDTYDAFRRSLARSILLGLEFLVAADIIGTVAVEPTLANLAVLGLIVLIRTFLSFSLELEIEGRWPWQRRASQRPVTVSSPEPAPNPNRADVD
jgi:uncharacterized membrane protein